MRVEPIREDELINEITTALRLDDSTQGQRRYLLWLSGIYLGRRISDLLKLRVRDVLGKSKITIKEKKTSKRMTLYFAPELQSAYKRLLTDQDPDDFLFPSPVKDGHPISRRTAYRDMQRIKSMALIPVDTPIGTHSLRKTFGYHYYKRTRDVATLMHLFNHSRESTTLIYIGVASDEIKDAFTIVATMYKPKDDDDEK